VIFHSLDNDRVENMDGGFVTAATRHMNQEHADWLVATGVTECDTGVLDEMRGVRDLGIFTRWIADLADILNALSNQDWQIGVRNTQFLYSNPEHIVFLPEAALPNLSATATTPSPSMTFHSDSSTIG
jgi:hypothetical protein